MHDLIRWKQDSTDYPYNILTAILRDSKTKDVETETFTDQKFWGMSRPRLCETKQFVVCRDRDQPIMSKSCSD